MATRARSQHEPRTCYDCEQDPCVCGDIFPYSRIRDGDKIYDHNGDLLVDLAVERQALGVFVAPVEELRPRTHCAMCGSRLRGTRARALGECRRCHK